MAEIYPLPQGGCYCNRQQDTQTTTATLTFKRAEILYDAENIAYVEGDVTTSDDAHTLHQAVDLGEEGNADRVTRTLGLAFSECVEMLYPYTMSDITEEGSALDDIFNAPEEYTIRLTLPQGFSSTTFVLLRDLIHEFLVCRVLADWFSITLPSSAENWLAKAEAIRTRVQTALMSRKERIHRKMKPF